MIVFIALIAIFFTAIVVSERFVREGRYWAAIWTWTAYLVGSLTVYTIGILSI